jgi:hypothetical protein
MGEEEAAVNNFDRSRLDVAKGQIHRTGEL